jgi:hypothetical protein
MISSLLNPHDIEPRRIVDTLSGRCVHGSETSELCPCRCNVGFVFFPRQPVTIQEWVKWFNRTDTWSEPNMVCVRTPLDTGLSVDKYLIQYISQQVRFLVVMRMVCGYAKEVVDYVVGAIPREIWPQWITIMQNEEKLEDLPEKRKIRIPSHLPEKQTAESQRIIFEAGLFPDFDQPFWFWKKWLSETGVPYRATLHKLVIRYNSHRQTVFVSFKYFTEKVEDDMWVLCP